MVPKNPIIIALINPIMTILGHLKGLEVGYKYSYGWVISTMSLQVLGGSKGPCMVP